MTRKVKEGKPVTITLNASVLDRVKVEARKRAVVEQRDCHYSDLIREAVDRLYPAE